MNRRRRWAFALLRKCVQVGVVAFIVWTAFGQPWRNYKVAHNSSRLVRLMHGDGWADAYAANERLLSLWGEPYAASLDFLGMPWAATVGGIRTADPILVASTVLGSGSWAWPLLLSGAVTLGIAALFGKVFCSHLCPMRLLFEMGQWIRGGLRRLGVPLPSLRPQRSLAGWVLLGGLAASVLTGMGVWFFLLPYIAFSAAVYLGVTASLLSTIAFVPMALLAVDILLAPGAFCRGVCPQGFVLENAGRLSWWRLEKQATPCPPNCRTCTMACPYGLSPRTETHRPKCDNCGRCVGLCPTGALERRFRLPVVAALFLAILPVTAEAHHNKGLPHYGYYENYPQVPTEEAIVIQGRWEMGATIFNFQGYERHNANAPNDVKFFVYLYDLEEDRAYLEAARFDIMLDGEVVSSFEREHVDEQVIYSTRETLPRSGDYELVAHIPGSETRPRLGFEIDLDEDGVSWWLIGGLCGTLLPLFGLAALGRGRRGRSQLLRDARPDPSEMESA